MNKLVIKKRLNELSENGHLLAESVQTLFNEYEKDKENHIPLKDSEARTILILGNDKIVFFVLKNKIGLNSFNDLSEEVSIGRYALIKAVDTFKADSGVKFLSYAIKVIENEILMYYRKNNSNLKNQISFEEYIDDQDNNDKQIRIVDRLGQNDENIESFIKKEFVNIIIRNIKYLNRDEQITIIHSFGLFGNKRLRQIDIAPILKKSRTHVSNCLNSGIKKLKVLSLSEFELTSKEKILRKILLNRGPVEKERESNF